jgi:hypothetical protein
LLFGLQSALRRPEYPRPLKDPSGRGQVLARQPKAPQIMALRFP